jgi:hypothetical protein
MTDVVTPHFWSRKKAGDIINNPCSYLLTHRDSGGGSLTQTKGTESYTFVGDSLTLYWIAWHGLSISRPDLPLRPLEDLVSEAKAKALAKVDKNPFDFGETIGEVRETIRFLRHPLESLHNISLAFRGQYRSYDVRKRIKAVGKTIALAELWAQYSFAAGPLFRSIDDLFAALTTGHRDRFRRETSHGLAKDDATITSTHINNFSGQTETFQLYDTRKVEAKATIIYDVKHPLDDWRFKYGLRGKDLIVTAWELTPYSFMLDRVISIKNALNGLLNLGDASIDIRAASVTVRDDYVYWTRLSDVQDAGWMTSTNGDRVVEHIFKYDRTPYTPSASDVFARPDWSGLVSDTTRTADLVSLILINLLG